MSNRAALLRHPLAIAGVVSSTVAAVVFVALLIAVAVGLFQNPYAGIVVVIALPAIFVFGVLLTDRVPEEYKVIKPRNYVAALVAAGLVFVALAGAAMSAKWPRLVQGELPAATGTVNEIGRSLLTDYLVPFEFASILLLVVLVGAARLARGGARQ